MRFPAAFLRSQPTEEQERLLSSYGEQARELRRSLPHLASAERAKSIASLRVFVTTAESVCDPSGLLEYFVPVLNLLELQQAESKNWPRMRQAAMEMADAAAGADLSKRQVRRLRLYSDALGLMAYSVVCLREMDRSQARIESDVMRFDELTAAETRDLEREMQRLERYMREERRQRSEIRRVLVLAAARRPATTPRPWRSPRGRRCRRRPTTRRVQSDSGGDGDPEPPGAILSAAQSCRENPVRATDSQQSWAPGSADTVATNARGSERRAA